MLLICLLLWYENSFKLNPFESCLVTLAKGHFSVVCQHLLKDFSSESTEPVSIKFHMQPIGSGENKIYIFGLGTMTKMATMPIYG